MNRLPTRVPMIVLATLLFGRVAVAQVKLRIPSRRFAVEERIEAKVANTGDTPITYCVEYGQNSPHAGTTKSTRSEVVELGTFY